MSSEREILACSLPPEEGSTAAEFEKRLPRKGPDCPLSAELIRLAEGKSAPEVAARVNDHLQGCEACRLAFQGFQRALAVRSWAAAAAFPGTGAAPPAPDPPVRTSPEWDAVVSRVADLFARGVSAAQLAEQTGQAPQTIVAALCAANQRGKLDTFRPPEPSPRPALSPEWGQPKGLGDLLRERCRRLRNLTVFPTPEVERGTVGKEACDRRIRSFGCQTAPLLVELLSEASHVGIGWGKMVAAAVAGMKQVCDRPAPRARGPLVCVATAGGQVGEPRVRPESSSSILATQTAELFNGDWEHMHTLHGVEAFIASYLVDTPDEIDITRRRIACFRNYQAIFGGSGWPGVIDQLDAIVTSCGNAHHYSAFWATELARLGIPPEKLNALTDGNIGGALLEKKEGLTGEGQTLLAEITRRWTGITLRHFEQCVERKPGVILLALWQNKADVVLRCVDLGLVSELIIDENLALALWDRVDPHRQYPHTLEVVRPAQAVTQALS
jgi:DNA-binding transcriptional regulator LsrR (DeoR family)